VRRTPERTALHLVVRGHLETFLATVREERGKDLPRYVEDELRRYVRCGIPAYGFLRVACPKCREEILVAYSCKCRGACPSCSARRMCGTAAHLVLHVLPDTPMRQWVLTAPFEVRRVMALRAEALSACNRIFVEEIARWRKASAGLAGAETGSVTFVQRFNATLGCFVHFHVVAPDGVFTRAEDGAVTFHAGRAPSRDDIADVAGRVAQRMTRWLRRRKLVDERPAEERSNEAPDVSPLEACMQLSLFGGNFLRMGGAANDVEDEHRRGAKSPWAAEVDGFNVHAGVLVQAGDRDGLERLCRYGARPPFSLERLSILPDGRVAYRLRKLRKNGATHLVLTPVQCLARIAALIPPPRFPLLRFAGVLAPSSSWRSAVVAMRPAQADGAEPRPTNTKKAKKKKKASDGGATALAAAEPRDETPSPRGPRTSLSAGIVTPGYARIDWATLLRRIYLDDVLACPCGGRRHVVAEINEREAIVAILTHLGIDPDPPPMARARDPTDDVA
jgi:ribosomal protein S27E